jgi:uncharacterized protein YgfB (UPF0149 family)
VDDAALKAK